jgi:hypothetical protein
MTLKQKRGVGVLWAASAVLMLLSSGAFASAQVDVLTQHNALERTGANLHETVLTHENVNVKRFGMLFKRVVDDQVYGQPLYVSQVKVGGGLHDVVLCDDGQQQRLRLRR